MPPANMPNTTCTLRQTSEVNDQQECHKGLLNIFRNVCILCYQYFYIEVKLTFAAKSRFAFIYDMCVAYRSFHFVEQILHETSRA